MEKTIEEIRKAVLAYCDEVCPQGARHDVVANDVTIGWMGHGDTMDGGLRMYFFADWMYIDADMDDRTALLAYRLLGLDKRDALEAERAFWTASTDSLTKSLEAEKVKNANGGEFKNMLQQVLNHSNRPEMDDAQFRMFARENINHLLYGNKEGKKDEN